MRRWSPRKRNAIPPRTLVATGLVLIAGGLIWPRVTVLQGSMGAGGVDFIQGVLGGIGIACVVMGIAGMLTSGRKGNSPPDSRA